MCPKARLEENQPLPERWTLKHGSYYYIVPPNQKENWDGKSWFNLGRKLSDAYRTFSERLHRSEVETSYMHELMDRFMIEYVSTLSVATQDYYAGALPYIQTMFKGAFRVDAVEPQHAYQMTAFVEENVSKKVAKQAAECLSSALSFAVRKVIIKINPLIGQFQKPTTEGRDRAVSDAEFIAFALTLPRKWQLYVMFKLHTKGRRKAEIFNVMRSHLQEEGVAFVNVKRRKDSFVVKWTPELRAIVTEILEIQPTRIGDAPLFFTRGFKPYIDERRKTTGFNSVWQRYMQKAIAAGLCEHFTEHDLRAKAVEHESLQQASVLLRHTSTKVTAKHYRRRPEKI